MQDIIENAKSQLFIYLKEKFKNTEFTILFNGEFFTAAAHGYLSIDAELDDLPDFIYEYNTTEDKIHFSLSNQWVKNSISKISESDFSKENILLCSQIKRLDMQIEFGLSGGNWNDDMYEVARDILYLLHTKSSAICLNIVKKCALAYNKLQIKGLIPLELTRGYKNALCIISLRYFGG
jgi:hypothetical protein